MKKLTLLSILLLSFSFGVFATDTRISEEEAEELIDNRESTFNISLYYLIVDFYDKNPNSFDEVINLYKTSDGLGNLPKESYQLKSLYILVNNILAKEYKSLSKNDFLKIDDKDFDWLTINSIHNLSYKELSEKYNYEQLVYVSLLLQSMARAVFVINRS